MPWWLQAWNFWNFGDGVDNSVLNSPVSRVPGSGPCRLGAGSPGVFGPTESDRFEDPNVTQPRTQSRTLTANVKYCIMKSSLSVLLIVKYQSRSVGGGPAAGRRSPICCQSDAQRPPIAANRCPFAAIPPPTGFQPAARNAAIFCQKLPAIPAGRFAQPLE